MEQRLFEPYGMDECGFGAPTGAQPWGHSDWDGGTPKDPDTAQSDNPPGLGPAGTVHCTLASWGQFVALHLRGARGVGVVIERGKRSREDGESLCQHRQ